MHRISPRRAKEGQNELTASMTAAPFFLGWFFAKKLPKKLGSSLTSTSRSRLLFSCAAVTRPFGSACCCGLPCAIRSVMIETALWPLRKSGCVVFT